MCKKKDHFSSLVLKRTKSLIKDLYASTAFGKDFESAGCFFTGPTPKSSKCQSVSKYHTTTLHTRVRTEHMDEEASNVCDVLLVSSLCSLVFGGNHSRYFKFLRGTSRDSLT